MGLDMQIMNGDREVFYWRKQNHIHDWFCKRLNNGDEINLLDDCRYLKKDDFEEFVKTAKEILEDHDKAEDLMPRVGGFYFGDKEYNEFYFESLTNTVRWFEQIIEDWDEECENKYKYTAWW